MGVLLITAQLRRLHCRISLYAAAAGRASCLVLGVWLSAAISLHAQPGTLTSEAKAARALAHAEAQGPLAVHAFVAEMPKGADLHMHLSGAVWAETFLDEAARDGVCVDVEKLEFDRTAKPGACRPGERSGPAALEDDNALRDALIDSFSMRGFVPTPGITGHDHFFATFGRFGGLGDRHIGDWLDFVATDAARQNEQYLEVMDTPDLHAAEALAHRLPFTDDFLKDRDTLLAAGLDQSLAPARARFADAQARRRALEHCGTAEATPACQVTVRFLFQVLREQEPAEVFAQVVFAFELARVDPDVVGLNFVQPEDGYLSMRDYALQMRMVGAMHALYPQVHITLHAGELAPGMVPPAGLSFHIHDAVEVAHAERIGHGVDIMYENHPEALLKEMAERHIMVEINLTSNAGILGITGADHPFPVYLQAGVPVALSTDDAGVERIDLTHEYARAAMSYHLSYAQLKQLARTSLEHSFLPGASLWRSATPERLTEPVAACRGQLGREAPEGACAALLQNSEKASQQWELERRFRVFERSF